MCSEQDLKDLGLPMGPRKKLLLLVQEEKGKKVLEPFMSSIIVKLCGVIQGGYYIIQFQ